MRSQMESRQAGRMKQASEMRSGCASVRTGEKAVLSSRASK